jgi:hypothetical protein
MSFRNPLQYSIVASGTAVSSPFDLRGIPRASLLYPASLDQNFYLQASAAVSDPTSASFFRIQAEPPNSATWLVSTPAGIGGAIPLTAIAAYPYGRLEMGGNATDNRSFTVVGKA